MKAWKLVSLGTKIRKSGLVIIGLSIAIAAMVGMAAYSYQETKQYHELQQFKKAEIILPEVLERKETLEEKEALEGKGVELEIEKEQGEDSADSGTTDDGNAVVITYDWDSLIKANSDIKGWLYLPGTPIDFPVVGTLDNGYYLAHDFWKQEKNTGCPFMDKDTGQWDFNRTIYAHSMGYASGPRFSPLLNYKDREYFEDHSLLYYTECYGTAAVYQIIAVVKYNVKDTQDWDFRTRDHADMESRILWMKQLKERALYYTEPETVSERILTLSTCDRSEVGKDGRLIIVAAKCNFNEK